MNRKVWALAAATLTLGFFSSCDKDKSEPTPVESKEVKTFTIDATAFDKFVYFNFETGKQVELTDEQSKTSTAWDIAFHRYDFRTNSGTASSVGKGGAAITTSEDIKGTIAMPDAASFKVDEDKQIVVQYGGAAAAQQGRPGVVYGNLPVNPVLTSEVKAGVQMPTKDEDFVTKGAIWSLGMPPAYYMNPKVFIIRTATGKYARLQVKAYKGTLSVNGVNDSKNGYVEFDYVYPVN